MGPIFDLVTADDKRLVDVMHLHLFQATLAGVKLGVVVEISPVVDRATPTGKVPCVTLRVWDSRESLDNGVGYSTRHEQAGVRNWYHSRDEALRAHVRMVQNHANEMVETALGSIGT